MELLIYIAILGIIITGLVTFTLNISGNYGKTYAIQEVNSNVRFAQDTIGDAIRKADSVDIGESIFGSNPGRIYLNMDDELLDPTIIILDADNGRLQIQEGLTAPMYVTSDEVKVERLEFNNYSVGVARVNIGVSLTISRGSDTKTLSHTVSTETAISLRQ